MGEVSVSKGVGSALVQRVNGLSDNLLHDSNEKE